MPAWRVLRGVILPLAVRHLVAHRLVTGVALFAMACGVGSMVAIQLMHRSVMASYEATILQFAGGAALHVTNGASGVPEEIADDIRRDPRAIGVTASIHELVSVSDYPGEQLYLHGVDLLAVHDAGGYGRAGDTVVEDPLVFLAEPDSVALTAQFLARHGLKLHDRIRVLVPAGTVELTIRAVLGTQRGRASVLDGRVAVVDLSVAQDMLRMVGRVSRVAVDVAADADVDAVLPSFAALVGARGVVERPSSRVDALARLLTNYRYGLLLAAATSMIVALYFVSNVATIAVMDRQRELGVLRTIGLRAGGVGALVLSELLMLSMVACSIGVPLGLVVARSLATPLGANVAALYLDVGVPDPQLDWTSAGWGIALGMLTPMAAAFLPLRHAIAMRPLAALRWPEDVSRRSYGIVALAGGLLLAGSCGVWTFRSVLPFAKETAGMIAMVGAVVACAMTIPLAVCYLVRVGIRVADLVANPIAGLAIRGLAAEIGRVAITCSAGLVSLAGTIAVATWLAGLDATLDAAFDTVFARIDLLVSAGADPFAPEATRIPGAVADEIASASGVAFVDAVRIDTIAYSGSLVDVVSGDARLYAEGLRFWHMIDGESVAVGKELLAGASVLVNQTFANRFDRHRGDVLEIPTPKGRLAVRIAGVYLEISPGDLPAIHLDRGVYREWWRDDTANLLAVSVRSGSERGRVADEIRQRWAGHRVVVFTLEQMRREYRAMLRDLAALVYPLLAIAGAVASIGVMSARVASMMARVRTAGVLRAMGVTRRQLTSVFLAEAAAIGAVVGILAVIVGSVLGRMQFEILMRGMLGMPLLYAYPHTIAWLGAIGTLLITSAAGLALGRRAAALAIGDALRSQ